MLFVVRKKITGEGGIRIDTDVWTTQDNSSYHNNVKMRVDA